MSVQSRLKWLIATINTAMKMATYAARKCLVDVRGQMRKVRLLGADRKITVAARYAGEYL